ncbi:MAG: carotenoid oxygenase family protein [Tildeniella nuda ZEHNDER 1965/U140]|jgi:carotenoid cleavage dioxygenase-like enzyme|nr:carotenoid oxygenase family protein [Tildeniella nuda ZEHNDER 1965/U140]
MVSTVQPTKTAAWANAVLRPATEFGLVPLTVLSGALPPGLRGSLYRNGPTTLERNGQRVGHWFDGDGGILGLHFTGAEATGVYRYVQTAAYQAETQAGTFLHSGYGMLPPGHWWERFNKGLKNAANTSVLALPDKLLALWEGGLPHALTLDTLETLGLDDLNGLEGGAYSAHPKRDPQTGDIFNFGISFGQNGTLNIYRSDASGNVKQTGKIPLQGLPLIHDCVLAGQYLVFCVPPVRLNALPLLAKLKSYSDALTWQPEKGTEIIVVDRTTLEVVSRTEVAPWYQWHFGNGGVLNDGSIAFDFVRYEDFQTNQFLKEVATGQTQTAAKGTLWRLRLEPKTGVVLELDEVVSRSCEFPTVQPQFVGQPSRYTYLSVRRPDADLRHDLFGAIARYDYQTATLTEADLGANRYTSEPIYAPDAGNASQGWLLTVVYDGQTDRSEAWIFNSDRLEDEPVCTLALPAVVPLGFHGTWKPNTQ